MSNAHPAASQELGVEEVDTNGPNNAWNPFAPPPEEPPPPPPPPPGATPLPPPPLNGEEDDEDRIDSCAIVNPPMVPPETCAAACAQGCLYVSFLICEAFCGALGGL